MTIRVYIDTNIFIYAILKDPALGNSCREILLDIPANLYEAAGSRLVAIEILGSLSRKDPGVARRATNSYVKAGISNLEITLETLQLAGKINEIVNIRYDAIHAALMLLNGIDTIITNDVDDWGRFSRKLPRLAPVLKDEMLPASGKDLELTVVTPPDYKEWKGRLQQDTRD